MIRHALAHLRSRPLLTLLLLGGSLIALTIPMALPIYADAATERALASQDFQDRGYRPPFAYLFFFSSSLSGTSDAVLAADSYLRDEGLDSLGLPTTHKSSFLDTSPFEISGDDGVDIGAFSLATMSDATDRMSLVAGRFPEAATGPYEILVHAEMAAEAGLAPGDILQAGVAGEDGSDRFALLIVGLWEAADPAEGAWIIAPDQLESRMFTHRDVVVTSLAGPDPGLIRTAAWYAIVDSEGLSVEDVDPLLGRADVVLDRAQQILPGIDRTVDPVAGLLEFRADSTALSRRLIAYSAPTLVVVLMFVVLIASMTTADRATEIAVLRSRGARRTQVIGRVGVEALLLVAMGFALAVPASLGLASTMGRVTTFLGIDSSNSVAAGLSTRAFQFGGATALLAMALIIVPAWGVSRRTVVDEQLDRIDRPRPWWQRASIDVVVIAVAIVAGFTIVRSDTDVVRDIQDPVNILFPAIVTLAVGLAALRLLPLALELVAWLLARTSSITALLAIRRAARGSASNHVPLLLLVVTVGLGIFTASLARTLDLQTADRAYHSVGADWVVQEPDSAIAPTIDGVPAGPRKLTPIGGFESITGVDRATRVGRYPARLVEAGEVTGVTFFGVDSQSFASVAFFRSDFAQDGNAVPRTVERLGAIPEGVIVGESLGLGEGDDIQIEVNYDGNTVGIRGVVVGVLSNFPTWSAVEDDVFIVGNLDRLFRETGDPAGYEVWMSLDEPGPRTPETGIILLHDKNPNALIADEIARPARQGGFGVLTAGFVASIIVSLVGFFVAAMFRVRSSIVELGAVQAMGLQPWKVAGVVVIEMAVMMAAGLAVGVSVGWWLSSWMMVRLTGDSAAASVLPLLPEMGTETTVFVVAALCGLFVVTAVALIGGLRRIRVFEVLKLGENP